MKVSELGEFGLIELMSEILGPLPLAPASGYGLLTPIGDDTALWRTTDSIQVLTTDTMVEGVHFRLATTSWRDLGWKALAINLSDIAAMGCTPRYAVVALGIPPETEVQSVADIYRGMADISEQYQCQVVGGDTVSAPCVMITVSLTGQALGDKPFPQNVLTRSGAREGDSIAVTGFLGASGAGLRMLTENPSLNDPGARHMKRAHNRPCPRVTEGQALCRSGIRAAMDLSDGLMADLPKLCKASGVAAKVYLDRIPVDPKVAEAFATQALDLALTGGEDYELLFAGDEDSIERATRDCPTPVTVIGNLVSGEPGKVTLIDESGREVEWTKGGWEHFTPAG
ncbi:MAG: thiamine-phosphate kinase [Dehalococcoidia bacterium]